MRAAIQAARDWPLRPSQDACLQIDANALTELVQDARRAASGIGPDPSGTPYAPETLSLTRAQFDTLETS
jgi:hypothetical protein